MNQMMKITNKITSFNYNKVFTSSELDEIKLSIVNLMDYFIENDPLQYSSPYFHSNIKEFVHKNIFMLLQHLYEEDILKEELTRICDKMSELYFKKYYPVRSYDSSFIRIKPNIENMNNKIQQIENKPQPIQRSTEWYEFRYNLITASNAWKALKSQATINQLIVEKCKELDTSKYNVVNTSTPMHHGNKYEEVSVMFYEKKNNTKVKDYGCIQHDTYSFLGASPDGINVDNTSDLYGRMLEIKNPTTRELTGIPKEDYWVQMQLQMEVCNLNECDFLECRFKEYVNEEEFGQLQVNANWDNLSNAVRLDGNSRFVDFRGFANPVKDSLNISLNMNNFGLELVQPYLINAGLLEIKGRLDGSLFNMLYLKLKIYGILLKKKEFPDIVIDYQKRIIDQINLIY